MNTNHVEYGLPQRQWNSAKPVVGSPQMHSSRPSTPSTSKELERVRLELDERLKALGNEDKDDNFSTSSDGSINSLLDALERTDPSQLTRDQLRLQKQRLSERARRHPRQALPYAGPLSEQQRAADEKRAEARSDHMSRFGKFQSKPARTPALHPKWRQISVLPEQRVLGVRQGPSRGDGGGAMAAYLACPRDQLNHDTETAWKSQLRSLAFSTSDASHRYGRYATNRGTVLGAQTNPEKITSAATRHVDNTYNSFRTAELAKKQPGAKPGGMNPPDISTSDGPHDWFQG